MEISRNIFNEKLNMIIKDIEDSEFLSIDAEFSGLDATASGHAKSVDTPKERYFKIKEQCCDFLLIQFGLCAFKANENQRSYEAKPYNFYVFPTPISHNAPDRKFLSQTSSIEFLCSHGFDFNKLYREGIPYLTPEQENKLRAEIAHKGKVKKQHTAFPDEHKSYLNSIHEKLSKYLMGEDTEPCIISCDDVQQKLIYQNIAKQFPEAHFKTVTDKKKIKCMEVTRAKSANKQQQELIKQKQMMELDNQVGFSKVIRALTSSKKLVIGHNMLLDIFHCVHQFHGALPADLEDFKIVTKSVLPRLLDTKLMATTHPLKEHISSSVLEKLFMTLQQPPFLPDRVEVAQGFDRYQNEGGALHEAGYDAFITGRCFVSMINFLGMLQSPPTEFTLPSSAVVEQFINKIYIMKSKDIPYIDFDSLDSVNQEPESVNTEQGLVNNHVFYVNVKEDWNSKNLETLFKPFGKIKISWLTKTLACVELYDKEQASVALKELSKQVGPFSVLTYAEYQLSKPSSFSSASTSAAPSASRVASKHKLELTDDSASCKERRLSVIPENDETFGDIIKEDENSYGNNSDHTLEDWQL